ATAGFRRTSSARGRRPGRWWPCPGRGRRTRSSRSATRRAAPSRARTSSSPSIPATGIWTRVSGRGGASPLTSRVATTSPWRPPGDSAGGAGEPGAAPPDAHGNLLVAGAAAPAPSPAHRTSFALARLRPDGTLDGSFGPNGDGRVTTNFGTADNPTNDRATVV